MEEDYSPWWTGFSRVDASCVFSSARASRLRLSVEPPTVKPVWIVDYRFCGMIWSHRRSLNFKL